MPLRDYQDECLHNVGKARAEGVRAMLAVSPTGTGKGEIWRTCQRPTHWTCNPARR